MFKTNEQYNYPLSFVSSFTGYIDQLLDTLDSLHKSSNGATFAQIKKNSESIFLFRKQIHKWKLETHSTMQQQALGELDQKLSKATRLNSTLSEEQTVKL
jgi:hypothetical protein